MKTYMFFVLLLESELGRQSGLRGLLDLQTRLRWRQIRFILSLFLLQSDQSVVVLELLYVQWGHHLVVMSLKFARRDCLVSARHGRGALPVRRAGLAEVERGAHIAAFRVAEVDPSTL